MIGWSKWKKDLRNWNENINTTNQKINIIKKRLGDTMSEQTQIEVPIPEKKEEAQTTQKTDMEKIIESVMGQIKDLIPADLTDPNIMAKLALQIQNKIKEELGGIDSNKDGRKSFREIMSWIGNKILSLLGFLVMWGTVFIVLLGILLLGQFPEIYALFTGGKLSAAAIWSIFVNGGLSTVITAFMKVWTLTKNKNQEKIDQAQIEKLLETARREKVENEKIKQQQEFQILRQSDNFEYQMRLLAVQTNLSHAEIEAKVKEAIALNEMKLSDIKDLILDGRIKELAEKIKILELKVSP